MVLQEWKEGEYVKIHWNKKELSKQDTEEICADINKC